jgi:hypothetical protein
MRVRIAGYVTTVVMQSYRYGTATSARNGISIAATAWMELEGRPRHIGV